MSKAPAFQFYPGDWLNDIKLQACSLAAQGLLINLMCLMHQSEKYGFLLINGSRPDDKVIIKLLKTHHKTFNMALSELLFFGVIKRDEDGVLYCKRMVKDQEIRDIRSKCGKLGGNPKLEKGYPNPYYLDKQKDNQKITPSSSSSSSSSNKELENPPIPPSGGDCPYQDIVDLYHEKLPELARLPKISPEMKKKLRARWMADKDRQTTAWWSWFFDGIRECDFLMGRKKDWAATLHWLAGRENMEKILSGYYINHKGGEGCKRPDEPPNYAAEKPPEWTKKPKPELDLAELKRLRKLKLKTLEDPK